MIGELELIFGRRRAAGTAGESFDWKGFEELQSCGGLNKNTKHKICHEELSCEVFVSAIVVKSYSFHLQMILLTSLSCFVVPMLIGCLWSVACSLFHIPKLEASVLTKHLTFTKHWAENFQNLENVTTLGCFPFPKKIPSSLFSPTTACSLADHPVDS